MSRTITACAFVLCLLLGATSLAGCGHCDGAIRTMHAGYGQSDSNLAVIRTDTNFRILGDGPRAEGEELMSSSGIGVDTWFLIDETTGAVVPATVTGDSGGHSCRNGVGFSLHPAEPLAPSTYVLVLLTGDLSWPYIGDAATEDWDGGSGALLHRYTVR